MESLFATLLVYETEMIINIFTEFHAKFKSLCCRLLQSSIEAL